MVSAHVKNEARSNVLVSGAMICVLQLERLFSFAANLSSRWGEINTARQCAFRELFWRFSTTAWLKMEVNIWLHVWVISPTFLPPWLACPLIAALKPVRVGVGVVIWREVDRVGPHTFCPWLAGLCSNYVGLTIRYQACVWILYSLRGAWLFDSRASCLGEGSGWVKDRLKEDILFASRTERLKLAQLRSGRRQERRTILFLDSALRQGVIETTFVNMW